MRQPAAGTLPPAGDDRKVLETIIKTESSGITKDEIRRETNLSFAALTKSLGTLTKRKLIKKISSRSVSKAEMYMGIKFDPSPEAGGGGGGLFSDGKLDLEAVGSLRGLCIRIVTKQKLSTSDSVHEFIMKNLAAATCNVSLEQIADVLMSLFLDNKLIEMKSTGLGECSEIPAGTTCYRVAGATTAAARGGIRLSGYASIPCGACPRISMCTPDGPISPSTCVYYNKWLDLKF